MPIFTLRSRSRTPKRTHQPHQRSLVALLVVGLTLAGSACAKPAVPAYPYVGPYGSTQGVTTEAVRRSNLLEQYVKDFLDGKVGATIPNHLVPEGRPETLTTFTLKRPNEVDPQKQWGQRAAHSINLSNSLGNFNDPHASYLVNHGVLVPFGSKIIIDGSFPKARYFSVQATPSFKPENYRSGPFGEGETSWLDADITPVAGSTNPYRVGANRNATQRGFRLTCDVVVGDPAVTDAGAFTPPNYRAAGNNRHCKGLVYKGPWGDPASADGDKRGQWAPGELWIRIYAPDRSADPFGGMAPPKVLYQLPDGRQYFIETDLNAFMAGINKARAVSPEAATDAGYPGEGWDKQVSILRNIYGGLINNNFYGVGIPEEERRKYVRDLDKGAAGRNSDIPGIMSRDPHATGGVHINYLSRGACVGAGKVFVLAGKLPTTPQTRNGEATMTGAQARYFSITGYSVKIDLTPGFAPGAELTSVMDDEIVTKNGNYTIMYGRAADRPANATTANGVTWVEWGPEACQSFTLRWITAGPEWNMAASPSNLSWAASWANANYDRALIGRNDRAGFLGPFQPVATYETKAAFEAHGNGFNPLTLPPH